MIDVSAHGFEIEGDPVGEGGSAIVHQALAVDGAALGVESGTQVALKLFKSTVLNVPNQMDRIRQEAALGQRIRHKHLVRAYGLLEDDHGAALVLEWVEGCTLEEWVGRQRKDLAWNRALGIALQIVEAVDVLHKEGVFHRDVKPENVMVRPDEAAVLMDIGIAEIAEDNEHTLHTEMKDFLGSVRYAAPQFILGEDFDAADDVYSLGLTLYFLFSGVSPYAKIQRKPVLPIRVVEAPPPIDNLRSNVPAPIKILLQACVHRDRGRRPKLKDVVESLKDPDGSAFLTRELERQAAEGRSYEVLKVMDDGATFYADLAGDEPEVDREYSVIRRDQPVRVKSYQREVTPERWIATAILKHAHQNVGYFKLMGRRWEEPRNPLASLTMFGGAGSWVEYEKVTDKVRAGDLVLKESSSADFA